ncbi:hypothetical protein CRYUN_Cryun33cG0068300 [Craigia yunnanensis]
MCVRRPEMEDSVVAIPRFLQVHPQMLKAESISNGMNHSLSDLTAHFYGVYDGHGGCQHVLMMEVLGTTGRNDGRKHSPIVSSKSMLRLEEFIEALVETRMIVNLLPLKLSVLLLARIKAAGRKVIQWNGSRVFGVLAMSRSIGDRYLKPWIIPDPEVMFVPRTKEDECLIIVSDGLWDLITNEEACEVARKRILLWHKKYGDKLSAERDEGVDPAAQATSEYLSMLALSKGSKDNITVIVVNLKAQRKFKKKT